MRRAFLLLCLLIGVHTFHVLRKTNSKNHQEMTRIAILRASAKACNKTPVPLNSKTLVEVCGYSTPENFEKAIQMISYYNVGIDLKHPFSAKHHFDNEEFTAGRELITAGIDKIVTLVTGNKFDDARETLGEILHTLQDFYSHSNWIELGYTQPCTALINTGENIPNPANRNQATCRTDCINNNCGATLLEEVLREHILTSGYFHMTKTDKPEGKCSHGDFFDKTSLRTKDGINKDYSDSSHGPFHDRAAEVAIEASFQLLDEIRGKIDTENGNNFRRLMGLHPTPPKGISKTIPFISFKSRYPDATNGVNVEIDP